MTIKSELTKNKGNGINLDFSRGGIIGNSVRGIITRIVKPNFVEIDFCDVGNKKQLVNINKIITLGFLDKEETKELKDYYK